MSNEHQKEKEKQHDTAEETVTANAEEQNQKEESGEARAESESETQDNQESADFDQLLQENEALKQEVEKKNEQILRKVAEFENMRKRIQRERVQLFEEARINSVREFLPVYDDLERTIKNIPESADDSFIKGVKLVYNKFSAAMDQMGVEPINETGVPFNVELHDALMRQPSPDSNTESDTVLQVLETGYRMGEKVIRHAKVIVSE